MMKKSRKELRPYTEEGYVAYDPEIKSPPLGVKIYLINRFGVAVLGEWSDSGEYIAWAPLLKVPQSVKERRARSIIL